MERLIRKRDGSVLPYQREKIEAAMQKAAKAVNDENFSDSLELSKNVEFILEKEFFRRGSIPSVEEIQDVVEKVLIQSNHSKAAKAFILYREKRREARDLADSIPSSLETIEQYLDHSDWRISENSNMTYSLQGLNFNVSSAIVSRYWLNKIFPEEIRMAHDSGLFHIHDLGVLGPYCVGWSLEELIQKGFGGVRGKVESAPPRHFRTALGQIVNFFYTLQGEAAGAQAFSSFDTLLAPFVRFDELTYKEVKQAMQEFVFNVNVPTRVGFQTPFTNLTFDLVPPQNYKDKKIVFNGKKLEVTYGDFQNEMNMINKAFAEVMMEGDKKGRIFTFPIPTYNIAKDFDWDNENLKEIWEMTAKYGVPYFANFVHSDMNPEDARSMCCRLRLDNRELRKRGGGLFAADPLTGSVGVVTINVPRIAYISKNETEFFNNLTNAMELAKTSLEIKRKVIEDFTEKGLYPYSSFYLSSIKESYGTYWGNHFSTIGLLGMNEAALNFVGKPISDPDAKEWVKKVISFMRDKISNFQQETGNYYNLEATPAEGASYSLPKKDKLHYDLIRTSGDNETSFYTNSVHLPVNEEHDIFEILEHQDELQTMFTGGTVVHLFLGESIQDWRRARDLVRKIVTNFSLPYFTLTPTFSVCPVHGYLNGENAVCTKPHSEIDLKKYGRLHSEEGDSILEIHPEIYSRIVGYFRPVENWNKGKKKEFCERKPLKVTVA
jgi:anaerobic ribonucleoside-triphosphate reductase